MPTTSLYLSELLGGMVENKTSSIAELIRTMRNEGGEREREGEEFLDRKVKTFVSLNSGFSGWESRSGLPTDAIGMQNAMREQRNVLESMGEGNAAECGCVVTLIRFVHSSPRASTPHSHQSLISEL